QNPVEQEGTYVLSEAQMDRFLLKVELDYPSREEEITILERIEQGVFDKRESIFSIDDIVFLQNLAKKVYVDKTIKKYITDIVDATRHVETVISADLAQYVTMGASTRASIAFMDTAKAMALMNGRYYCTPEDVKAMRHAVLRHRIMLNFAALADGIQEETIIDAIVNSVKTP
ncbi:MAG: MoxR family ATPase, partial [Lachnospiraceae bacterium]|nr:MoxR family ATPase [Lachnospiraceae bacterium]